jgi:hypothetical protein
VSSSQGYSLSYNAPPLPTYTYRYIGYNTSHSIGASSIASTTYNAISGFTLSGGIWLVLYNHQINITANNGLLSTMDITDIFGISDSSNVHSYVSVIPSPLTSYHHIIEHFNDNNHTSQRYYNGSFIYDLSASSQMVYLFNDASCNQMTINSMYTQVQVTRIG